MSVVSLVATTLQRLLDAGLERVDGLRCVLLGRWPGAGGARWSGPARPASR